MPPRARAKDLLASVEPQPPSSENNTSAIESDDDSDWQDQNDGDNEELPAEMLQNSERICYMCQQTVSIRRKRDWQYVPAHCHLDL